MTPVNGLSPLSRRTSAPSQTVANDSKPLHSVERGDDFMLSLLSGNANEERVAPSILRADTYRVDRAIEDHDLIVTFRDLLLSARQTVSNALERTSASTPVGTTPASAAVREIYEQAFPGVTFTDAELGRAAQKLNSEFGIDDLRAKVQEGARLINDPSAADEEARQIDQSRYSDNPNRQSILSQQLRFEHLAELMQQGFLPQNKFDVVGRFGYSNHDGDLRGQYLSYVAGNEDGKASKATSSSLSGTGETSGLSGEEEGNSGDGERNSFGGRMSGEVSVSSANASSLSQAASELAGAKQETNSPVMLDLNHDGRLGVTGNSSAKDRIDGHVGRTVSFDIDGDGNEENVEWMAGDGDGMLVDDRDGGAQAAARGDGVIDGKRLFGDQGGKYANGYDKMKALDANRDGKLSGRELDGLKTWIDDGDAKVEEGELKTLAELGVTELSLDMHLTANDRGEMLMRSTFVQNGVAYASEDVWFAEGAASASPDALYGLRAAIDTAVATAETLRREAEVRFNRARLETHASFMAMLGDIRA